MKIILINPPVCNDIGHKLADTPPLGLLYLASFLEKNGYREVKVVDADVALMSWPALRDFLIKEKPEIVGLSGASLVLPALIKTAQLAKEALPGVITIAGGFGPTKEPEKVLRDSSGSIDFIVRGEGEVTLLEMVKQIESREKRYNQIKGLAYLDQNNLVITESREAVRDLDSLPWPAYHLLEQKFSDYGGMHARYKEMGRPNAVMIAARGCPHRCTFCSLGSRLYRQRNPRDVVDEMESYVKKFQAKSIQLYDDEFVGLSPKQNEWINQICDEIIRRDLDKKLSFLVQGRCSQFVDLKTLQKMRQANFRWIWWGVESGSQKVLDLIKKDLKIENVIRDFSLAKQAGIKSLMFIMVGFPGETPADIKMTAALVKKIKPDDIAIHIVTPYPGSEMRKYLEENNLLETTDYYKFNTRRDVIHHTQEMTAEEIKKYFHLLVFRFSNGHWYFIKFFFKSLTTIDGWKKLFKRIKMAFSYFSSWFKINVN
ncbi:MAG: radical SAM protein [Patescibacteria group bacterium]